MKAVSEQEEQELLGTADGGGRGVDECGTSAVQDHLQRSGAEVRKSAVQ